MNIKTFLTRMQAELQGFSQEERFQIDEEIRFHYEKGMVDAAMGKNEQERLERMQTEMGNPEELGRRMRNIHHPKRWVEYLLITLPEIVLMPILNWIILTAFFGGGIDPTANSTYIYWLSRVSILFEFSLVLICLQFYRKQGILTGLLFWLSSTWLTIFSLCFRENRWLAASSFNQTAGGIVESIFWGFVLLALLVWLVRILIKKRDPLLYTLVLIPALIMVGNIMNARMMSFGAFPDGYSLTNWNIIGNFGFYQLAHLIWPALFLFPKQRIINWLALLVYAAPMPVENLIASPHYPVLMIVWAIPLMLVSFNGIYDSIRSKG